MNRQQIENTLKDLAKSQGFYGRLLARIYALPETQQEALWSELEGENFADPLDVVMYFEC